MTRLLRIVPTARALLALALTLAVLAPSSRAASPSTPDLERLTLPDARSLMIERNRELQLARNATAGAEADVTIAGARPNPSLTLGAGRIGGARDPDAGPLPKRVDTAVGVSQLFERGRKREIRTEAAQYTANAARREQVDVERQQRVALESAYYDLVLAQEKRLIAIETSGLFDKTIDAARRRVQAGDLSRADLARLNVDALRARNELQNVGLEEAKARVALAYLMGVERDAARIHAAEAWPALAPTPGTIDLDRVIDRRPDVEAAQARLRAADKNRELAQSLRTRDVTAGVQYDRQPTDVVRNGLSFNVSVPLFTRYYFQGEIGRAEAEYDTAQTQLERVRAVALTEISSAAAALAAAADRVQRFREALLAAAEQSADAAEFAYTRGAIGVMDLLDARRQLHAVRIDAATALADYARAYSAWTAATEPPATSP
ncbi:MAG: outer rane efflux protein [Betaproteobacteria bacterium]|nr:outer rane efflux protein [Betaproteobacteria bacterium]